MRRALAWVGVTIALAGCFGPRSDPSTFYLLTAAAARGSAPLPVTLGVGPITLPAYLDRPQMVTRLSENQVALSEVERWAEPLRDNVWRTIAENLTRAVQPERVVAYPWHPAEGVDYGVAVDFARFEADSTGGVHLEADWRITDATSGEVVEQRTARIDEAADAPGTEPTVAALSRALAGLSDEVAGGLRRARSTGR